MKSITKGDKANFNFHRVLRSIWLAEGISRIELCEKLNLDKATISTIVSFLMNNEIIQEISKASNAVRPGRKPIGLAIRKDFGCVIGIEFHKYGLNVIVTDLKFNLLAERTYSRKIDAANIEKAFSDVYHDILSWPLLEELTILSIGVAIPGIVDHHSGIIRKSIELGIIDTPYNFRQRIFDAIDAPCFIDNNANCAAWSILSAYREKEYKNFLFVHFTFEAIKDRFDNKMDHLAMGLGIVLNGKIYFGPDGSAGEFRSISDIASRVSQFSLTEDELKAYKTDENVKLKLIREIADHIALLVNVFNFKHLFMAGSLDHLHQDSSEIILQAINENWAYNEPVDCEIHMLKDRQNITTTGAAGMFLESLFSVPSLSASPEQSFWRKVLAIKQGKQKRPIHS